MSQGEGKSEGRARSRVGMLCCSCATGATGATGRRGSYRHVSPPSNEPSGTLFSSIVSLSATAIGAGMLSLPISIYYCGAALGTAMIILFAGLSDISMIMLLRCASETRLYDYESLAYHCIGHPGRIATRVVLISLLFGIHTSFIVVVKDTLLPPWAMLLGYNSTTVAMDAAPW